MNYRSSCDEPRSVLPAIRRGFNGLAIRMLATIVEQTLFAGTNFVVTILLVRWMAANQMGAYSFSCAILVLFLMMFEAIVSEPIPICGSSKYESKMRAYTGAVLYFHIVVAALVTLCLIGLAVLFYFCSSSPSLGDATFGAAVAAPLLFLRPTTQQLCYTHSFNGAFTLAAVVFSVGTPAVFFLLHSNGILTPISAFAANGFSTAFPCLLIIATLLRPALQPSRVRPIVLHVMLDHWGYGRWSSIAQGSNWIGSNIYYLLGPLLIGLDATAAIRAIFNVVLPIHMINNAILAASLPTLAQLRFSKEGRRYHQLVWQLTTGLLILTGGYFVAVLLGGARIIHIIYGGILDHFITLPLILSIGAIPVLTTLNSVLEMQMRVSGNVKWVAAAKTLWILSALTVGIGAVAWFGLLGVFIGWAISCAVLLAANTWCLRRQSRPSRLQPGGGDNV